MRYEILQQILDEILNPVPTITLADLERELRKMFANDSNKAERAVGSLYGGVFKNKEKMYEAHGGRMP